MFFSVQSINEQRAWIKNDVFKYRVYITGETRGEQHAAEFSQEMKRKFPSYIPE